MTQLNTSQTSSPKPSGKQNSWTEWAQRLRIWFVAWKDFLPCFKKFQVCRKEKKLCFRKRQHYSLAYIGCFRNGHIWYLIQDWSRHPVPVHVYNMFANSNLKKDFFLIVSMHMKLHLSLDTLPLDFIYERDLLQKDRTKFSEFNSTLKTQQFHLLKNGRKMPRNYVSILAPQLSTLQNVEQFSCMVQNTACFHNTVTVSRNY